MRTAIIQPALPKYRVPIFRALARRPALEVEVLYSSVPGIPNAAAEGFAAREAPMRMSRVAGQPVYWQHEQWRQAGRRDLGALVYSWDVHYASLVPALLRARRRGIGTVLWGHGISRHDADWRGRPKHWLARLADVLLLYSPRGAEAAQARGWPAERVFVALNSLDQAPIREAQGPWREDAERLRQFRAGQGLGEGPVLLFVARLSAARRLDLLLRGAARLIEHVPAAAELRVVIIGDGPARPELEALARSLPLPGGRTMADHVRFVGALYDEPALAPWFCAADAFVFPSYMGLSLLHAFGYGLPVVTSDRHDRHGPEVEALVDGDNGLLFRDGDVEDLARTLERLLTDEALRRRLTAGARRTVEERYTLERMADGFEAAILAAAGRGRRA